MTEAKPAAVAEWFPAIEAYARVFDRTDLTVEDRAATYAVLHQVQLWINRRLRPVRRELVIYLEATGQDRLGPIRLKASPVGVAYPVNSPGNYADLTIQEALHELHERRETRPYVRLIPEHYELDYLALTEDLHLGKPAARQLWREVQRNGWRTEEARNVSLAVDDVVRFGGAE